MLECPDTGGDPVLTDTVAAYEKLSPGFRQRLHGLHAEHTETNRWLRARVRVVALLQEMELATFISLSAPIRPQGTKPYFVNSIFKWPP